jgi:hypothetical protein
MKKNILIMIVCLFSLAIFSGCGDDDSACDRAKENAAQECEGKGYEARNCSVKNREKDIWGNTSSCTAQCQCYSTSSRSSEFIETSESLCFDEDYFKSETQKPSSRD